MLTINPNSSKAEIVGITPISNHYPSILRNYQESITTKIKKEKERGKRKIISKDISSFCNRYTTLTDQENRYRKSRQKRNNKRWEKWDKKWVIPTSTVNSNQWNQSNKNHKKTKFEYKWPEVIQPINFNHSSRSPKTSFQKQIKISKRKMTNISRK